MKQQDRYCVINLNMINWLTNNGFKILKLADNKNDQKQKVAYFYKSKELLECMARYKNQNGESVYGEKREE